MTEAQWRTCTSPEAILNFLTAKASPRKLRLYAIGCCRRIWRFLDDDRCRHAIEMAQRFADGRARRPSFSPQGKASPRWRASGANRARRSRGPSLPLVAPPGRPRGCRPGTPPGMPPGMRAWSPAITFPTPDWEKERVWQAALLLDLFGNPFRPVRMEPSWLFQGDGAVHNLAQVIYDEGSLWRPSHTRRRARRGRLRQHRDARALPWPAEPLPRCWVVDLILDKE